MATNTDVVDNAAKKYGVPLWILRGVWGMETDFGRNVTTSSANAVGDFQFIPSTAKSYNYPLTNTPTPTQFQAQADSAAHYLSDLKKQHGSWDAALRAYSGGGYGQSDVVNKSMKTPAGTPLSPGSIASSAVSSVTAPISDVAKAISFIFSLQFLYIVFGSILLIVALILVIRQTTAGSGTKVVPLPL